MKVIETDVAIIGAGTAGFSAFREAEKNGKQALMIEGGAFGTTCARVGCMPSKLLIAASERAEHIRHAGQFGIQASIQEIQSDAVLGRVRSMRDFFTSFVVEESEELEKSGKLLRGYASFINDTELRVGEFTVKAKAVVIAIGSKAKKIKQFECVQEAVLTNEEVFEIEKLPGSLLVVGTGVIGLELGQAFSRLGVHTTFFGKRERYAGLKNPEAIQTARDLFNDELDIHETYEILDACMQDGKALIKFKDEGGYERQQSFEKILVSIGKRPAFENLSLERIGVKLNERGMPEFSPETFQVQDKPVFIAGDASQLRNILHEAAHEGRIAGRNAANFPKLEKIKRTVPFAITFTDPQIAHVGPPYPVLKNQYDLAEASIDYTSQGRARIMAENKGKVFLWAAKDSGKFVGAELIAPHAEHMAHLLAWCIELNLGVEDILKLPFYHPVLEEGVKRGFAALKKQLA